MFILTIILSCKKNKLRSTEYLIKNNTLAVLIINSCSVNRSSTGTKETCLTDNINANDLFSLRKTHFKDGVTISDAFSKLEIKSNTISNKKDVLDNNLWVKEVNGNNIKYTLTVDSLFFK